MPITKEHEIHERRLSRNMGVGLALVAMVALVFGLTMVKVKLLDPAIVAESVE
ncbi:MAG: hypothetical protein ACSHXD_18310 [Marinosulfonomonas sp.]